MHIRALAFKRISKRHWYRSNSNKFCLLQIKYELIKTAKLRKTNAENHYFMAVLLAGKLIFHIIPRV